MIVTSEELAPIYICQLSSDQLYSSLLLFFSSSIFFPTSCIGKKRLFNKTFDINSQPLTKDYTGKEVDIRFISSHCLSAVKANKAWQRELLNSKPVCMIKAIPLTIAIFWDPNSSLCTRYTLNFAKKLELKTKNLRADIVNRGYNKFGLIER